MGSSRRRLALKQTSRDGRCWAHEVLVHAQVMIDFRETAVDVNKRPHLEVAYDPCSRVNSSLLLHKGTKRDTTMVLRYSTGNRARGVIQRNLFSTSEDSRAGNIIRTPRAGGKGVNVDVDVRIRRGVATGEFDRGCSCFRT